MTGIAYKGNIVYITDNNYKKKIEDKLGEQLNFFGEVEGFDILEDDSYMYKTKFKGKKTKIFQTVYIPDCILEMPSAYEDSFNIGIKE